MQQWLSNWWPDTSERWSALRTLRTNDALFLVAARPNRKRWLVAVLERPATYLDKLARRSRPPLLVWRVEGKRSTTPVVDATSILSSSEWGAKLAASQVQSLRTLVTAAAKPPESVTRPAIRWRFVRVRSAAAPRTLTPMQRRQLAVGCTFFDGFETRADNLPPAIFSKAVELWRVLDGRKHVFDFWSEWGDSGTLFFADSAEPVGIERVQGGFDVYAKAGWVKRGLLFDLHHLAWELSWAFADARGRELLSPPPEPRRDQKVQPRRWKTRGPRKGNLEGFV